MPDIDFALQLRNIVERVSGAVSASLVGMDGIALAGFSEDNTYDVALADAEFAELLAGMRKASHGMGVGNLAEMVITAEGSTLVARMIGTEFYIFITLKGEEKNLGLARIELRRLANEFAEFLL